MRLSHPLGPGEHRITQRFGVPGAIYTTAGYLGHEGLDFGAPVSTAVYAAHDGMLLHLTSPGYGVYARVAGIDWETTYGHLSGYVLPDMTPVTAGTLIARSGNTGNSTAPHLHFGVRPKPTDFANGYGGYVDPEPLLREERVGSKLNVQVQNCSALGGPGSWVIEHVRQGGMTHALLIDPDVLTADPWPGVDTMGRLWFKGDPDLEMINRGVTGAREYDALCAPRWARCPWIKLWHGPNEPYTGNPNDPNDLYSMRRIAEFYVELAQLMHQRGLLCGGPVFGTGQPAGPPSNPLPTIEAKWRILGPACNVLDALVVHEYGMDTLNPTTENEWHVGAYRRGVATLRAAGYRVPPIWITEHGIDRAGGATTDGWRIKLNGNEAEYMRQLAVRDAEYSADPQVASVHPFTWLDHNWPSFAIIRTMSERIVAHRKAQEGPMTTDELSGWLAQVPATIKAVAERGYMPLGMERVATAGGYWGLGYGSGRYRAVRVRITASGLEYVEERDLGGAQVKG